MAASIVDAMIEDKIVAITPAGKNIHVAEMRERGFFRYGKYYYLVFIETSGPEIRVEKEDFDLTSKNIKLAIETLQGGRNNATSTNIH